MKHTAQLQEIVAVRDLDGGEHRIDVNPPTVPGMDLYAVFRMQVEFTMLVWTSSDDELDCYLEQVQRRLEARVGGKVRAGLIHAPR